MCRNGRWGKGCGEQPEIVNCADIAILPEKHLWTEDQTMKVVPWEAPGQNSTNQTTESFTTLKVIPPTKQPIVQPTVKVQPATENALLQEATARTAVETVDMTQTTTTQSYTSPPPTTTIPNVELQNFGTERVTPLVSISSELATQTSDVQSETLATNQETVDINVNQETTEYQKPHATILNLKETTTGINLLKIIAPTTGNIPIESMSNDSVPHNATIESVDLVTPRAAANLSTDFYLPTVSDTAGKSTKVVNEISHVTDTYQETTHMPLSFSTMSVTSKTNINTQTELFDINNLHASVTTKITVKQKSTTDSPNLNEAPLLSEAETSSSSNVVVDLISSTVLNKNRSVPESSTMLVEPTMGSVTEVLVEESSTSDSNVLTSSYPLPTTIIYGSDLEMSTSMPTSSIEQLSDVVFITSTASNSELSVLTDTLPTTIKYVPDLDISTSMPSSSTDQLSDTVLTNTNSSTALSENSISTSTPSTLEMQVSTLPATTTDNFLPPQSDVVVTESLEPLDIPNTNLSSFYTNTTTETIVYSSEMTSNYSNDKILNSKETVFKNDTEIFDIVPNPTTDIQIVSSTPTATLYNTATDNFVLNNTTEKQTNSTKAPQLQDLQYNSVIDFTNTSHFETNNKSRQGEAQPTGMLSDVTTSNNSLIKTNGINESFNLTISSFEVGSSDNVIEGLGNTTGGENFTISISDSIADNFVTDAPLGDKGIRKKHNNTSSFEVLANNVNLTISQMESEHMDTVTQSNVPGGAALPFDVPTNNSATDSVVSSNETLASQKVTLLLDGMIDSETERLLQLATDSTGSTLLNNKLLIELQSGLHSLETFTPPDRFMHTEKESMILEWENRPLPENKLKWNTTSGKTVSTNEYSLDILVDALAELENLKLTQITTKAVQSKERILGSKEMTEFYQQNISKDGSQQHAQEFGLKDNVILENISSKVSSSDRSEENVHNHTFIPLDSVNDLQKNHSASFSEHTITEITYRNESETESSRQIISVSGSQHRASVKSDKEDVTLNNDNQTVPNFASNNNSSEQYMKEDTITNNTSNLKFNKTRDNLQENVVNIGSKAHREVVQTELKATATGHQQNATVYESKQKVIAIGTETDETVLDFQPNVTEVISQNNRTDDQQQRNDLLGVVTLYDAKMLSSLSNSSNITGDERIFSGIVDLDNITESDPIDLFPNTFLSVLNTSLEGNLESNTIPTTDNTTDNYQMTGWISQNMERFDSNARGFVDKTAITANTTVSTKSGENSTVTLQITKTSTTTFSKNSEKTSSKNSLTSGNASAMSESALSANDNTSFKLNYTTRNDNASAMSGNSTSWSNKTVGMLVSADSSNKSDITLSMSNDKPSTLDAAFTTSENASSTLKNESSTLGKTLSESYNSTSVTFSSTSNNTSSTSKDKLTNSLTRGSVQRMNKQTNENDTGTQVSSSTQTFTMRGINLPTMFPFLSRSGTGANSSRLNHDILRLGRIIKWLD